MNRSGAVGAFDYEASATTTASTVRNSPSGTPNNDVEDLSLRQQELTANFGAKTANCAAVSRSTLSAKGGDVV
jgi:hypothetical protein